MLSVTSVAWRGVAWRGVAWRGVTGQSGAVMNSLFKSPSVYKFEYTQM